MGMASNYRWTPSIPRLSHPAPTTLKAFKGASSHLLMFSACRAVCWLLCKHVYGAAGGNEMKRRVNGFPEIKNSINGSWAPPSPNSHPPCVRPLQLGDFERWTAGQQWAGTLRIWKQVCSSTCPCPNASESAINNFSREPLKKIKPGSGILKMWTGYVGGLEPRAWRLLPWRWECWFLGSLILRGLNPAFGSSCLSL